jgi:hypothetical protein
MKIAALGGALAIQAALALPSPARADVVGDWNATAANVIAAKGASGPAYFALVHVAIYDAVNSVDGRYAMFAVGPTSDPRGASREAAAASAAYSVLLALWPDQQSVLDAALASSLAAVPDGAAKNKGVTIGTEVASAWLAARANDGREANVPYTFGTGPGVYQRTPPGFRDPVTPWLAKMKPFALTSPSQFRAYGPPDLTSQRYARDFETVKALGSATSTERTPEETEIGLFHTENPTLFWSRNLRNLADTRHLGIDESARLYALLFVTFGDGAIACFDSKYYYNFWRPVTAIPAADTDNNPNTDADATWLPLAATPPHPEYPAAHGCAAGGITEILRRYFGTREITFTFTSTVAGTVPHTYHSTDDLVEEIKRARVFGGMHFPTSVAHGVGMGKEVGNWVFTHYFNPVKKPK